MAAGDGRTGDPVFSFLFRKCWEVSDFPVLLLSFSKLYSFLLKPLSFRKNRNNTTDKKELDLEIRMACLFLTSYRLPTREFPEDLF